MKISGFSFIRNGQQLGFPFLQSIQSILPICDEFVIAVGESDDDTLALIQNLNEPKIKIIETVWNDHMRVKGYVYGQQKMIAQYACTGDWAFYLEGDEVVHEDDLPKIKAAMQQYLDDDRVEALAFHYRHFYGNINTYLWSPAWYRIAPRIIKTSVRSYAPDGLYWLVLDKSNKKGRYPDAAVIDDALMYHYGWVRTEAQMKAKLTQVEHLWDKKDQAKDLDYGDIDGRILRLFEGSHPQVVEGIFPEAKGIFAANSDYCLSKRERKHRKVMMLERLLGKTFWGNTHCRHLIMNKSL